MDTKIKKEVKDIRLTIRLSKNDKSLIGAIRSVLSSRTRVELNETQAVVSALKIAAQELKIKGGDAVE